MTLTMPAPAGPGPLRVFSFGGGWQSVAALALAARGVLDFRVFLFANVGDDSEDPATLAYIRDHAAPFAAAHGLDLHALSGIRLEDLLNARWDALGKDHVYLSRYGTPLRKVVPDTQVLPFGDDDADGGCDSGWCFT